MKKENLSLNSREELEGDWEDGLRDEGAEGEDRGEDAPAKRFRLDFRREGNDDLKSECDHVVSWKNRQLQLLLVEMRSRSEEGDDRLEIA